MRFATRPLYALMFPIGATLTGCAELPLDELDEESVEQSDVSVRTDALTSVRTVGTTPAGYFAVSYDDNNAYFTYLEGEFCTGGTFVKAQSLSSGAVRSLFTGSCISAAESASDGSQLYFLEWGADDVRRVNVSGTPLNRFVSDSSGAIYHRGLAVDASAVYWSDEVGLRRAPKTGGAATTLAAGDTDLFALDASHVYYDLHVDYGRVELRRVPLAGGPSTLLHTNRNGHGGVVLAGDRIVYLSREPTTGFEREASIRSLPKAGGSASSLYVLSGCSNRHFNGVVGDGRALYWSESSACAPNDGRIRRLQFSTTGAPTVVTERAAGGTFLHLTPSELFWVEGTQLKRAAR